MNKANIVDIKNSLKYFLSLVAKGEDVIITRRNLEIAKIVPIEKPKQNRTVLGCGVGSVEFMGDVLGPIIPESEWGMLK